ncbi:MAG: radical SAM protein, partial [Magnetococcales bacterium]|nr:radical SAM protein [Magnetococcales bacterium]
MALIDRFGRTIRYLRLSVTDRCNFRCAYCRPASGLALAEREEVLSDAEMVRLAGLFAGLGVGRFRLTGGEPLVRPGIVELARSLVALPGVEEITLSTNASRLAELALPLRRAGVRRVNISLDSLDPAIFSHVTRGGDLAAVLAGIDGALAAGLHPVKVNMVVMGGINDHEIPAMVEFARRRGVILRFIETMPVGEEGEEAMGRFFPASAIFQRLRDHFGGAREEEVSGPEGSGPARYLRVGG